MSFTIVELNSGMWTVVQKKNINSCDGVKKCFIMNKYEYVTIIGNNEGYSLLNEMCIQQNVKTMSVILERNDYSNFIISNHNNLETKFGPKKVGNNVKILEVITEANKELPTVISDNCLDITHMCTEQEFNLIADTYETTTGSIREQIPHDSRKQPQNQLR